MPAVPMLTPGSITGMTGLDNRPIFFLRLNGGAQPTVVVKGEAMAGAHPGMSNADVLVSIKWGSKMMKNVNNQQVNTKIMTAGEVNVFTQFAQGAFPLGSRQLGNLGQPYKWVKMPMVRGLSDAEYYNDNADIETIRVKRIVVKLLDDAVWRDLGGVLAVDIFTGNSDRFDVGTGNWVNKGNLMFLDGGATAVIGLDTFDPNSMDQGNLASGGGYPELRKLNDANERDAFALAVCRSVGSKLKTAAESGGLGTFVARVPGLNNAAMSFDAANIGRLYEGYAPLLSQGIADGAVALRNYLQGKAGDARYQPRPVWRNANPGQGRIVMGAGRALPAQKTLPQGVRDRMNYLGW